MIPPPSLLLPRFDSLRFEMASIWLGQRTGMKLAETFEPHSSYVLVDCKSIHCSLIDSYRKDHGKTDLIQR